MLKKLGFYIKDYFCDLKQQICANKIHLYICIGAFLAGFLVALSKQYSSDSSTSNFVFLVFSGNSSPVSHFIKLTLWLGGLYAIWFLTAVHFVSFLVLGYGSIFVISFLLFQGAFIGIAVHPVSGLIYTILYLIPTMISALIGYVLTLKIVYEILNYDCNRRALINLSFHHKSIRKKITPVWCKVAVFSYAYWLILYLILIMFL